MICNKLCNVLLACYRVADHRAHHSQFTGKRTGAMPMAARGIGPAISLSLRLQPRAGTICAMRSGESGYINSDLAALRPFPSEITLELN